MSYDIYLTDPQTKQTILFNEKHCIIGGTYALGGTNEAWLNVTYNYAEHFVRVLGDKGIRSIYGLTGKQSMPILEKAISGLKDNVNSDYWKPTEGNAKQALINLSTLAMMAPHGIWKGD